nr:multidrug effflux MFS transporter [uncultured Holophaga sp.]
MPSFSPSRRRVLIVLLGGLSAVAPFCIDSYLPAFGQMATSLGTTVPRVGLSLSSYFLGICLGQLAYGPILDRFGRKTPLLWGMGILLVASLGCALAPGIRSLIAWRFLQAAGGCVGMVAGRALVVDLFAEEASRVFSSLMLVMGLAPVLAPSVGGWISLHFGWRAIFHLQACFALVLFLGTWGLLAMDRRNDRQVPLHPGRVLAAYGALLKERTFLTYSMAGNWANAGLLAYIAASPFVYMKVFGLSEAHFAWAFGINAIGFILGGQLNVPLLRKTGMARITATALWFQLGLSVVVALGGGWLGLGAIPCMILIWLFLVTQGVVFPNAAALSLVPFPERAGSASALSGAIMMALSALASALVSSLSNGTLQPMVIGMTACAGLAILFMLATPRSAGRG